MPKRDRDMISSSLYGASLLFAASAISARPGAKGETLRTPVEWFHVPKTGTSFINTIYHSQCPSLPISATCPPASKKVRSPELMFMRNYPPEKYCPPEIARSHAWIGAHLGLYEHSRRDRKAVGFFREPWRRVLSGYSDSLHDAPEELKKLGAKVTLKEYGRSAAGITTAMLSGRFPGLSWVKRSVNESIMSKLTDTDVDMAIQMLNTSFQFVGLTEHWALSICLWHVKFGSKCTASEFVNVRPRGYADSMRTSLQHSVDGTHLQGSVSDDQELQLPDWAEVDKYDQKVWQHARDMFWRDILKHEVSEESCKRIACAPRLASVGPPRL